MELREIIARFIKNYRVNHNLNQYEFAEECGISRNLLSLIETQNGNITLDTLTLLSARMGISPLQLLGQPEVVYFVLPSKVIVEGITYDTYGIGVLQDYLVVDYVLDLSIDFEKVKSLVQLCNDERLALVHLRDVVEDFIIT